MHNSMKLRIESKNHFIIPYIKGHDKKNLISCSLRINIISKSIEFYGLLHSARSNSEIKNYAC